LDAAFDEFDVGVADVFGDDRGITTGNFQHVVGHVYADDFTLWPDDLGGDEADFSGARAEVEDGFTRVEPFGGISAAVVFFDDFGRDGFEELGVVVYRAAEVGFDLFRGFGVAVFDGVFGFHEMV